MEAGPCILCVEDRCTGCSRGSASGRLRRCSNGVSFIYESHVHQHSTSSRVYPSLAVGGGVGVGVLAALLGSTQPGPANPAGGFLTPASRYETEESEASSGGVGRVSPGPRPSTRPQAAACSASSHVAPGRMSLKSASARVECCFSLCSLVFLPGCLPAAFHVAGGLFTKWVLEGDGLQLGGTISLPVRPVIHSDPGRDSSPK